jgi:hypothetical protein
VQRPGARRKVGLGRGRQVDAQRVAHALEEVGPVVREEGPGRQLGGSWAVAGVGWGTGGTAPPLRVGAAGWPSLLRGPPLSLLLFKSTQGAHIKLPGVHGAWGPLHLRWAMSETASSVSVSRVLGLKSLGFRV